MNVFSPGGLLDRLPILGSRVADYPLWAVVGCFVLALISLPIAAGALFFLWIAGGDL